MNTKSDTVKKAFTVAFPYTIPTLAGFMFLGISYGVYMSASGFSFLYPMFMSAFIYAGSMEFITVNLLLTAFNPLQALATALIINARHIFYGISMLDKYKGTGWKKGYLIFGMCDESFSINYTADIPHHVDKGWFMFFVNLLNQGYWIAGSTLGGILGSLITFNLEGIDFVLTAIFVVIFLEQWLTDKKHINAIIGLLSSLIFLILLGPDNFIIPAMVAIVVLLTLLRKKYNIENDTKPQNESEKPKSQKTESTESNRGK